MSIYLITYHLQEQSHNHNECDCNEEMHADPEDCACGGDPDYEIIGEIECLGRWAQFMPTSFLVNTSLTSDEILEKLAPTIGEKDLLFVSKVDSTDVASLTPQVKDWILRVESE